MTNNTLIQRITIPVGFDSSTFEIRDQISSGKSKEPPYNIDSEINRIRSYSISQTGLEENLFTLFSEINRNPIGPEYTMYLGNHGRLQTSFSNDPLFEMYAASNQITEIDKIRSPRDQNGIRMLENAIAEFRFQNRKAFSWIMISPSLGIDSGFVMIEIGRLQGDKISPQLVAQRLAIPVKQFENPEFNILKELANRVSGGKFHEANHPFDILGEVIFREKDDDLIKIIDENLQEILGKKVLYGDSEKSFQEETKRLNEIWMVLKTSGEVDKFLDLLKFASTQNNFDINILLQARNSLINKFLDLKEIYEKKGSLQNAEIRIILSKSDGVLTRDASGFCAGEGSSKARGYNRAVDKYGADNVLKDDWCQICGGALVRESDYFVCQDCRISRVKVIC